MKFKSIFILFNIIILFFLVFVLALPYFIIGEAFFRSFWESGWPLLVLLVLILAGIDVFYLQNRRLFTLLEREDWPALVQYLEEKVLHRGNYSARLVKLLASSYLVLSDPFAVIALEKKLAVAKPALLDAEALTFASARILSKDTRGAVEFLSQRLSSSRIRSAEWVRWYYGFALLLNRDFEEAANQFTVLAGNGKDAVAAGLSGYFLHETLAKALPERRDALAAAAEEGKSRVRGRFKNREEWLKEVAKVQTEVYAAILSKYFNETTQWIYGGGTGL